MSSAAPHLYNLPANKRPKSPTPLQAWLDARGMSQYAMARLCFMSRLGISNIANGQALPSLISAFRIEEATGGGVPVASWLGTDLGRLHWNNRKAKSF